MGLDSSGTRCTSSVRVRASRPRIESSVAMASSQNLMSGPRLNSRSNGNSQPSAVSAEMRSDADS